MESFNLEKLLNRFLDWKMTFMLHCGKDLLTNLYKCFLKVKENVPKYGKTTSNSFLGIVGTICLGTYSLSKNFLIHWSIMVLVTFENTSQEFYVYIKIFHSRANFEKPEQKRVNETYLVGIRNKTTLISKHSTKCIFAQSRSNKPFFLSGNFDI